MPVDMLASSLSSVKAGSSQVLSLKIKLTHKVSPCITLELELVSDKKVFSAFASCSLWTSNWNSFVFQASQSSSPQYCIHDVPVTIVDTGEWKDYQEPTIINYDVSIGSCSVKINAS